MSVPQKAARFAPAWIAFAFAFLLGLEARADEGLLAGGNLDVHLHHGVDLLVELCDFGLGTLWAESLGFLGLHPHEASPPCAGFRVVDFGFIALAALAIVLALRFRHTTQKRRLELARQMVERGMEPPDHLLGRDGSADMRRGLVLVFSGLGIVLASFLGRGEASAAGLVPGFIGLGYLASHFFARRDGPGGGRT